MPTPIEAPEPCPTCDGAGTYRTGDYAVERDGSRYAEYERCDACDGRGTTRACECCPSRLCAEDNDQLARPESIVVIDGVLTCGACTAAWVFSEVFGLLAAKEAA